MTSAAQTAGETGNVRDEDEYCLIVVYSSPNVCVAGKELYTPECEGDEKGPHLSQSSIQSNIVWQGDQAPYPTEWATWILLHIIRTVRNRTQNWPIQERTTFSACSRKRNTWYKSLCFARTNDGLWVILVMITSTYLFELVEPLETPVVVTRSS